MTVTNATLQLGLDGAGQAWGNVGLTLNNSTLRTTGSGAAIGTIPNSRLVTIQGNVTFDTPNSLNINQGISGSGANLIKTGSANLLLGYTTLNSLAVTEWHR